MSDTKPKGQQVDTIPRFSPQVQESFDLNRLDGFVKSLGVDFIHYRAIPSPIGQNDRGDLRRNDGVDTITSNGMIYRYAGRFTATMTDNSREQKRSPSGVLDPSEARLVMTRFYKKEGDVDGNRIYLAPGDRLYLADPDADTKVATSQKMDYEESIDNEALYPIISLLDKIIDSRNIEYVEGVDFIVTVEGRIRWLAGGKNPGIDPLTRKGRVYSIVYLYKAFYYVTVLPKEVRVTNVTTNGVRSPERMPMHAIIVREYIFHNQNRGDKTNQNITRTPQRKVEEPQQSINPNQFQISVDMTGIANSDSNDKDEEQS